MPKILRLDSNQIRDMKKKTPGAYGEQFEGAITDALRHTLSKGHGRFDAAVFDNAMQWFPAEKARIDADFAYLSTVVRMDAGEAAYFARQLEYLRARTRDVKYPEGSIRKFITISGEAGPAAESITTRQYDVKGGFKLASNSSENAPRIDITASEGSSQIRSLEASYGYTIMDLRRAMMAGLPLSTRLANGARMAYEMSLNDWGYNANGGADWAGVRGLLYLQNVLNTVTDEVLIVGNWCNDDGSPTTTTPNEILKDISTIINYARINSKTVHKTNTVLLPTVKYSFINTTLHSDYNGKSILEVARSMHPGVTFGEVNELAGVACPSGTAGTTNVALAFENTEENIVLDVPQPFEEFPVVFTGKEYLVTCHYRIGGVSCFYPKSFLVAEGL